MLDLEPPDHTRLRRLVSKAFTPRTVEGLRAAVQRLADELVDGLVEAAAVTCSPTSPSRCRSTVIAEMLGIPEADRHLLRPWSADICGMYELNPSEETAPRAVRAQRRVLRVPARAGRGRAARAPGRRPDHRAGAGRTTRATGSPRTS